MEKPLFLLVEDNEDIMALTLRVFRKHKLQTRLKVVGDGQQALDYLLNEDESEGGERKRVPDLVLLDLQMPKMGGIETLRHIKRNRCTRQIPVVVLTTSQNPRDILMCYDLGANGYVEKPTNYEELEDTLLILERYWSTVNLSP